MFLKTQMLSSLINRYCIIADFDLLIGGNRDNFTLSLTPSVTLLSLHRFLSTFPATKDVYSVTHLHNQRQNGSQVLLTTHFCSYLQNSCENCSPADVREFQESFRITQFAAEFPGAPDSC